MELTTILLPAIVPALADGLRGIFARITNGKGALPQNVKEAVELMEAQTARVKALAELDALAPNAAPWVANVRGVFRYAAVGSILFATMAGALVGIDPAALAVMLDLSGASMAFIIGERMYLQVKR